MKKIFLLTALFLLFASIALVAQTSLTLEKVCTALAARPNTCGDFIQIKTISSNGRQLKSSGSFIISPLGIMWKTEKPFPSSLILTEDSMIQIAANGNKSVMDGKDNQTFSNISATLSSIFSGNAEALKSNFEYKLTDAANGTWALSLQPKDSTIASVMKEVKLSGTISENRSTASLDSLEISESSNNTIHYDFLNQKYPEELSADEKQNFIAY